MKPDWIEERRRRVRLVKKWLRPLPRRSGVHRYPVLKWFGGAARRRAYLWSFRSREVVPAIYLGLIVAILPLVGVQMLVVSLLAIFLIRANLPILVGLQWVSNPLTMGPIYYADYQVGMALLQLFGIDLEVNLILRPDYDWGEFEWSDLAGLLDTFPPMMLGGFVLGSSIGVLGVAAYKFLAKRSKANYSSIEQKETNKEEVEEV